MVVKDVHIIFNPMAGAGKAGRILPEVLPEIRRQFDGRYVLHVTNAPLDATCIASEAVQAGARLIIAAGGDGTVNEVINGMFNGDITADSPCSLGILDFGTGKGLAQTLALPSSFAEQLDCIVRSPGHAIDVGKIRYTDRYGNTRERLFISECQVGIGSAVADKVHSGFKFLGGRLAFGIVSGIQAVCYKANTVTLQLDEQTPFKKRLIGIVIGNGCYCAGGMKLTPSARPDDACFDILCIHEMSIAQRLQCFPKIYTGDHVHSEHFSISRNRKVRLSSDEALMIEADGEMLGRLPCVIEILPALLKVKY